MKILKQDVKYVENPTSDFCQWIERIGRVCYKSEDKITDGSAIKFIEKIFENGHLSVLEHLNIILKLPISTFGKVFQENEYKSLRFFEITKYDSKCILVSGNLRSFYEIVFDPRYGRTKGDIFEKRLFLLRLIFYIYGIPKDSISKHIEMYGIKQEEILESIIKLEIFKEYNMYRDKGNISAIENVFNNELNEEQKEKHESATFYIMTDRGVSHEFVRHRIASYSQSSTRYCNYSKGKFDNEISYVKPVWFNNLDRIPIRLKQFELWKQSCLESEKSYMGLIEMGQQPQEARSVLNNSLMTEFYCTMKLEQWKHFLYLRTSSKAHPQMRDIAYKIEKCLFKKYPEIFR